MNTALVFGGTRFFGKRLVDLLIAQGIDVTIATRGLTMDSFGDKVRRVTVERTDRAALARAFEHASFDVVFDQIGYASMDMQHACDALRGKVKRYIFTSSLSVYDPIGVRWREEGFDPYHYPLLLGEKGQFSYQEGKRQAEAALFQVGEIPAVAVRFPIVLGEDDYTRRLHFHIEHVKHRKTIGMPNVDAALSFISSEEAARFLLWVADSNLHGPVNACMDGEINLHTLLALIEKQTGEKSRVVKETNEVDMSPFGVPESWCMDITKASSAGYHFPPLIPWMTSLIETLSVKA